MANGNSPSSVVRFIIPALVFAAAAYLAYRVAFNVTSGVSGSPASAGTPAVFAEGRTLESELAAGAGKPEAIVVADFTAVWCGPCQRMKKDSWTSADVVAWARSAQSVVEVDVDKEADVAQKHHITAMPTTIVFRGGKEVDRSVGYLGPRDLLAFLKESAARH